MESKNIEKIFLSTLLQIAMVGVCLVLIADIILFPRDVLSIVIDSVILSASIFSYCFIVVNFALRTDKKRSRGLW